MIFLKPGRPVASSVYFSSRDLRINTSNGGVVKNFSKVILFKIQKFSIMQMYLKMWSAKCPSLKRKSLHFDEMFITGCTGSCQNDNFQCSQWWKFRQNDDIFVSVMMTSSYGNIFRVTGLLRGEFTGQRWIPTQRPVTRSFDVFFDLRLKQQLSKQWDAGDLGRHRAHHGVTVMVGHFVQVSIS